MTRPEHDMSLNFEGRPYDRPLPTDITLRVPEVPRPAGTIYRRQGVIASLVSAAFAPLVEWRGWRRKRWRSGAEPPVPDWLREDVGLPPAPPRLPEWWELWRK